MKTDIQGGVIVALGDVAEAAAPVFITLACGTSQDPVGAEGRAATFIPYVNINISINLDLFSSGNDSNSPVHP